MKKYELFLSSSQDRDDLHDYLSRKLEFPYYYGRNLDALYDCLTEITEDTCIGITEQIWEDDGAAYIERMNRVFREAEEVNPSLCVFIFQI